LETTSLALIREDDTMEIYGANTYNADCISGCSNVETGCTFLAAENYYYVSNDFDFTVNNYCWAENYTESSVSLSVQYVHRVTASASSATYISSSVYSSSYELIIVELPKSSDLQSIQFSFAKSVQTELQAEIGCAGFTAGTNCVNEVTTIFDNSNSAYISDLCNCEYAYITVSQATSCGNARTDFTIVITPILTSSFYPVTQLTAGVWTPDTLPVFAIAPEDLYHLYAVQATSDGFVHVAVGNVNNTDYPSYHSVSLTLYSNSRCLIQSCKSGALATQDIPSRSNNDATESCYVYTQAEANELFYAMISIDEDPINLGITYRLKSIVSYTDLETTSNQHFQIQGLDRHYYKVNGRKSGLATNDIQSVVIDLQIIDGDRLNVFIADSTEFMGAIDSLAASSSYSGWYRRKTCYFGLCTIEIPTRVQHPGANVFYVWVETVTTNPNNTRERIEKPTNYMISATTGKNNCESSNSFTSGFCSSVIKSLTSVYKYRDVDARNNEAECRYENLLCGCTHSLSTCQTKLQRFSCLESFRECDASGFWTPLCRYECTQTVAQCGDWSPINSECTDCTRPEYNCLSQRYSDESTLYCTGEQSNVVRPSPTLLPSSSASITPTATPLPSSTNTPSSASSNSPTPTISLTPSISTTSSKIIIFIEENSASSLLSNTFLVLLVFAFHLFFLNK